MTERETVEVCAAVIVEEGRFLLTSRPEGKSQAGFWEFPGGKVEPHESHADCLIRELEEELGILICPGDWITSILHDYPEKRVCVHFYFATLAPHAHIQPKEDQLFKFVPLAELSGIDILPADEPVIRLLLNGKTEKGGGD